VSLSLPPPKGSDLWYTAFVHASTWTQRYENLYQTTFAPLPRPFRQFRMNRSHTFNELDAATITRVWNWSPELPLGRILVALATTAAQVSFGLCLCDASGYAIRGGVNNDECESDLITYLPKES